MIVLGKEIDGYLTFFYYNDLERAARFYGEVLGFELVMSRDWVTIFRVHETGHLGLVDQVRGSHKPSPEKPVRLQIWVRDVLSWFNYLNGLGLVEPPRVYVGEELRIKTCTVKDPEGYTVEFCEYITPYGDPGAEPVEGWGRGLSSYRKGELVGEIRSWCEAARNEAKDMSLSAPFMPINAGFMEEAMREEADREGVSYYLEKALIRTDLFPNVDLDDKWVYVIYKKPEVIEEYHRLHDEWRSLLSIGMYVG